MNNGSLVERALTLAGWAELRQSMPMLPKKPPRDRAELQEVCRTTRSSRRRDRVARLAKNASQQAYALRTSAVASAGHTLPVVPETRRVLSRRERIDLMEVIIAEQSRGGNGPAPPRGSGDGDDAAPFDLLSRRKKGGRHKPQHSLEVPHLDILVRDYAGIDDWDLAQRLAEEGDPTLRALYGAWHSLLVTTCPRWPGLREELEMLIPDGLTRRLLPAHVTGGTRGGKGRVTVAGAADLLLNERKLRRALEQWGRFRFVPEPHTITVSRDADSRAVRVRAPQYPDPETGLVRMPGHFIGA